MDSYNLLILLASNIPGGVGEGLVDRLEEDKAEQEVADAVDDVEGNPCDPPGEGHGGAPDEQVGDCTEGAEGEAVGCRDDAVEVDAGAFIFILTLRFQRSRLRVLACIRLLIAGRRRWALFSHDGLEVSLCNEDDAYEERPHVEVHDYPDLYSPEGGLDGCKSEGNKNGLPSIEECEHNEEKSHKLYVGKTV